MQSKLSKPRYCARNNNYAFLLVAFFRRLKIPLQFFGDNCVCLPPFLYSTFVVGFSVLLFSFSDGSAVPLNVNSIALYLPVQHG